MNTNVFLTTESTEYTESKASFFLRILCVLWLRINSACNAQADRFIKKTTTNEQECFWDHEIHRIHGKHDFFFLRILCVLWLRINCYRCSVLSYKG
jgi:hypothetical protein